MGFGEEERKNRFGFLLKAFKYGAPLHGGLAFDLDMLCMLMLDIREVIAFPKTQNSGDSMSEAPSFVDEKQLEDLNIAVV